jgi:hypothetical protein
MLPCAIEAEQMQKHSKRRNSFIEQGLWQPGKSILRAAGNWRTFFF